MTPTFLEAIQRHHPQARKLREYAEFVRASNAGDTEAADRWFAAWERETVRLAQEEASDE